MAAKSTFTGGAGVDALLAGISRTNAVAVQTKLALFPALPLIRSLTRV